MPCVRSFLHVTPSNLNCSPVGQAVAAQNLTQDPGILSPARKCNPRNWESHNYELRTSYMSHVPAGTLPRGFCGSLSLRRDSRPAGAPSLAKRSCHQDSHRRPWALASASEGLAPWPSLGSRRPSPSPRRRPVDVPAVPWPAGYQLLTVLTPARLWSRSRGPPCSCRRVLVPPYPLWAAAHQEWEWRLHACMVASSSGTCRCTDGSAQQWIPEIAVGLCFICQCRWLAAAHSGFVHALTCRAVPCRGSAGPLAISPCDNLRLCTSSTCMEEQTVTWHHPCGP